MSRTLPIRVAIALALALPGLGASAASALTASAVASQTSGVAPLAVFFDARGSADTGASSDDMFLNAQYAWNFGDTKCVSAGATWKYGQNTNRSKCKDLGPVAAHVYESAGTYTAQVTVYRGSNTATRTVTITVSDPNTYYSGTATTCVSKSGSFSGCPSGANRVTSSASWPSILSSYGGTNRRVLFNRGETWNVPSAYTLSAANMTVGAYGAGSPPQFSYGNGSIQAIKCGSGNSGLRVMDVEFTGDNVASDGQNVIQCWAYTAPLHKMLFLRVNTLFMPQAFFFDPASMAHGTANYNEGLFVVDSTVEQKTAGKSHNNFLGGADDIAIMGTQLGPDQGTEHVVRIYDANGMVFSHNRVVGPAASGKVALKLHDKLGIHSQGVEIADSEWYGGAGTTFLQIGPQDASHPIECVTLVRVERNYFETGNSGMYQALTIFSGRNLVDSNILNQNSTNTTAGNFVNFDGSRPSSCAMSGNLVSNNVWAKISDPNGGNFAKISGGTGTEFRNNLAVTTNTGTGLIPGSASVDLNNLMLHTSPFVASGQPTDAAGFQCKAGSPPVDAGTDTVALPWSDFSGTASSRKQGSHVDIGPWESGSTTSVAGSAPSPPVLLP